MTQVFLTGYQGETINEFLKKLKKSKVEVVVDVREVPLSRKNGFSKKNLSQILNQKGIKYYHFEELGSPISIRNELREKGDYLKFFEAYRKHARKEKEAIENVLTIVKNQHSAIMCFEKECELCHRTILASELLKLNHRLQVTPL